MNVSGITHELQMGKVKATITVLMNEGDMGRGRDQDSKRAPGKIH